MTMDHSLEALSIDDMEGYDLSFLLPIRPAALFIAYDLRPYSSNNYWKWTFYERYWVNTQQMEEMRVAGWEVIDEYAKQSEFFCLTSQLALVLVVSYITNKHLHKETWVRRRDLRHVEQYPVTLLFDTKQAASAEDGIKVTPGMYAAVFEGEATYRYEISQLGDVGIGLLRSIMTGMHVASAGYLPHSLSSDIKLNISRSLPEVNLHKNPLEQFARARMAAAQLSKLYWQLHLRSVTQSSVHSVHSLMDIPSAFRHAHLYENHGNLVPATDALEAAIRAMSDAHDGAKGWGNDHSKRPTYIYSRPTSITAVTLRMNQHLISDNEHAIAQQLWERVTTYSDNDGDILLAMLAQVVAAGPDEQGGVWITGQAILDYRGILPKRHEIYQGVYRDAGHRSDDLREIADCVERLRDMHVSVKTWREARKPGGRRRKIVQESYLVLISDFLTQTEEGQTQGAKEDALQIAWYYRPGSCLDIPLRKNAQVAWLLQQALRYDPYRQKWEKRLARYFMFQLRINSSFGGITIKRRIRDILEESGLVTSIDTTNPARTRERFETAMNTLIHHGHISDWSEAAYRVAVEQYPTRGKMEKWLDHELEITAAPLIEDLAHDALDHIHTQQRQITTAKRPRKKKGEQ